jgi:hypothetical protein
MTIISDTDPAADDGEKPANEGGDTKSTNSRSRNRNRNKSRNRNKGRRDNKPSTPKPELNAIEDAKADFDEELAEAMADGLLDDLDAQAPSEPEPEPEPETAAETAAEKAEESQESEDAAEETTEAERPPAAVGIKTTTLPSGPGTGAEPRWTSGDLRQVAGRALAVLAVLGLVGYGLGVSRGGTSTARTEFVYTLDESVPDSFLREDRRLLTQVVTFTSDAVLTPVAERFDTDVDDLRGRIDVETLEMSEVLRLDVSDPDADQALAISEAVLDRYLAVTVAAQPVGDGTDLTERRAEVAAELAAADTARLNLDSDLADLDIRQAGLERRITAETEQRARIQDLLADAAARQIENPALQAELDRSSDVLSSLEGQLSAVATERADVIASAGSDLDTLAVGSGQEALLREIERLEAKLATVDAELAERELAPLVAAPIRSLDQPVIIERSANATGLQGLSLGLLVGLPVAVLVAMRTRQRQLWFG